MGKPFLSELHQLEDTYSSALALDTSVLDSALSDAARYPLVAVGSGGSLSAAHFACYLHELFAGRIAKASTPLEILSLLSDSRSRRSLADATVICLSAGGSNTDINRAFRALAEAEPRSLLALCARTGSPLADIGSNYRYANVFDFGLPSRKDGFLATNSLLAFATLLARSYSRLQDDALVLPSTLWELMGKDSSLDSSLADIRSRLRLIPERNEFILLYGTATKAAAVDIESKFTEAALGSVQTSDYRNFAHGRHHWLAKRGQTSTVIALAGDRDLSLAQKTVALLPSSVPSVVFHLPGDEVRCAIGALITGFLVTAVAGEMRGIDPGRPGVPQFGRRLYHLSVGNVGRTKSRDKTAIQRKSVVCDSSSLDLEKAYKSFIRSLSKVRFDGVVFDYDGTLCDTENRFGPLGREIAKELVRLLRADVTVGIATGRGKSVRKSLEEAIPRSAWSRILIGYYNGGECKPLADSNAPNGIDIVCQDLESVVEALSSDDCLKSLAKMTIRRKQISLEPDPIQHLEALWELAGGHVSRLSPTGIRMVMSGHSVDVLAPGVSKKNVVDAIRGVRKKKRETRVLCIGDQGRWPGNDSDLLSEPHSLSVDVVSSDLSTCWNVAPAGYRGSQATMFYLKCLVADKGRVRFDLKQGWRS